MKDEEPDHQPAGVKCYDRFFCTGSLSEEEVEKCLGNCRKVEIEV